MTPAVRALFSVIAYLGGVVAPLVFAAIGASQPSHGLGELLGRARLRRAGDDGLEFALVARPDETTGVADRWLLVVAYVVFAAAQSWASREGAWLQTLTVG
jgi:hypothetical protein